MHPTNAMVDSTISSKFYPNAFLLVVQTFRVHLHLSNLFWKRPLCFTALGMFLVRHWSFDPLGRKQYAAFPHKYKYEVAKDTKNRWQMIQNMGWQMTEWQMKHNHWSDPLGWKQYAAFPHNSRHRVSAHPVVQFLGIFSFGSGSRLHLVRLTASSAQTLCCKSKSIEANTCVDQCEECLLHLITRRVRGKRIRIKACNLPPWNLVIACEDQPSLQTQDTMHTLSHLHKICHFFGFGGKCVELKGGKKTTPKKCGSCVEGSPCAHTITLHRVLSP